MIVQLHPSPWLYSFLRGFEKFRPTAYKPTPKDVWTIGYGHTEGVREGDTCTMAQAEEWLQNDVVKRWVLLCGLLGRVLNQNQIDALTSLVFNIGVGKKDGVKGDFADSALLTYVNIGQWNNAAHEFPKWDHQGGMELAGLLTRRNAEAARFLTPC